MPASVTTSAARRSRAASSKIARLRRILLRWGRLHYATFPWRSTRNPYHALIAELLLQRTRAEQVVPVYEEFVRRYPTPSDLAAASLDDVRRLVHSLGLRWRAKYILEFGGALAAGGGAVPDDSDELLALPGVGPYAAAAYGSFHGRTRGVIVDSNVVRLYGRLFGLATDGETRRDREFRSLADRITPRRVHHDFNYALLDFTRTICRPKPRCGVCPLRAECRYYKRPGRDSLTGP